MKKTWTRIVAACLALVLLVGTVAAALNFDLNGDGKVNVWDLQAAVNQLLSADDQAAALREALGGGDELHKNAEGKWEIWSSLGLYNMAKYAQAGDTFLLMQDVDMGGEDWTPVTFKGVFDGQGHTISNVKITKSKGIDMGFFAEVDQQAQVKNLNLAAVTVTATENAEYIGLLAGSCDGKLENCTTTGLVIDERTTLTKDVYIGTLAGRLNDSGRIMTGENRLAGTTLTSRMSTRFAELTTDTYRRIVGVAGYAKADNVAADATWENVPEQDAPIPATAIATVTNGDKTVAVETLDEMLSAIASDGKSEIKLYKDITGSGAIRLPYSCTIDFDGHTLDNSAGKGNGLEILAAGSENAVTTLKNGTLIHWVLGVRVNDGGIVVDNMEIRGLSGCPVGIYSTEDHKAVNKITNSTLSSAAYGCVTFGLADTDFTATGITIDNSVLISQKTAGQHVFVRNNAGTQAGTITLGENVDIYTYASATAPYKLAGKALNQAPDAATVTVAGTQYTGLNHFTTNAVAAATAIATVTNGTETVNVETVADMVAAVAADGNTQIKLLKNVTASATIKMPYSFTMDLGGYTLQVNSGNGIEIAAAGSAKKVTTVKNGTLKHNTVGVRVNEGGIIVENMTIHGTNGSPIGLYDPNGDYRHINRVTGSTLVSDIWYPVIFNKANTDYTATGITIDNSTLVSCKSTVGVFGKNGAGVTPGTIYLGENVDMYSYFGTLGSTEGFFYAGKMAPMSKEPKSVTVVGKTLTGMNHWSTENEDDSINLLMIGNSFCYYFVQELYGIAKAAGVDINVTNLYEAGCYVQEHWTWLNDKEVGKDKYQFWVTNSMGRWKHGDIRTSYEALEYLDWDVITLQQHFAGGVTDQADALAKCTPYADDLFTYLKTNYPKAKLYWQTTWAYQVGHASMPSAADQALRQQNIIAVSATIAQRNGVDIVPSGQAWTIARANPLVGDVLCRDDLYHDGSVGGGQYLNACVWFEVLTGKSCIGSTWRPDQIVGDKYNLDETKAVELQKAAHEAVANMYGADYAK